MAPFSFIGFVQFFLVLMCSLLSFALHWHTSLALLFVVVFHILLRFYMMWQIRLKKERHGKLMGMRTVAGRVVKESYDKAKQQHIFTVEVLWSEGRKKLPPLFLLLVKGHDLYKLKADSYSNKKSWQQ